MIRIINLVNTPYLNHFQTHRNTKDSKTRLAPVFNNILIMTKIFRNTCALIVLLSFSTFIFADQCPYELPASLTDAPTSSPTSIIETVKRPGKEPIFLEADRVRGIYQQEIEGIGSVVLRRGEYTISADRMKYFQNTDDSEGEGNVRLERTRDVITGKDIHLNLEAEVGFISNPDYYKKDNRGRGTGELLLFEGKNNFQLIKSNYTTCPKGNDDWYIRAGDLKIDNKEETGTARNVSIRFKDVPIMYLPWINFSYSGKRKTGMLAPIIGNTGKSGADLALPIYINIAPNIDATIAPRLMSKRGIMINNELRYIGRTLQGRVLADILPHDLRERDGIDRTRYGVSFMHNQHFGYGWSGNFNYNRVSDDRFFRDLANNLSQTSKTNLLQRGLLSHHSELGPGGLLSFSALIQQFQTLQDPVFTIFTPYKRLPQLKLNVLKRNIAGLDLDLKTSWTRFSHPTLEDGQRLTLFPSVSAPLRNSFGYITPKFGLHYTRYSLSPGETLTAEKESRGKNFDRMIPVFSLDSGVTFDRQMSIGGREYIQTLEPRVYYLYAPFRDQDLFPNFDSAESDFSFAQLFTENRFSGNDRFNDANQMTIALTSRFLDPTTGAERLRMAVGQQFRFIKRRVRLDRFDTEDNTLKQTTSSRTDFIAAISGRLTSSITTDTNVQFDQSQLRVQKIRTGVSYQPETGKVINLGYRFTRDFLEQVDTSVQWPFTKRLHGIARINYSLRDDRILAGLAGIEYKACCWALRFVLQRLTTATRRTSTAFFVQLQLNGLMEIGSDPLRLLQQSIPGYANVLHD